MRFVSSLLTAAMVFTFLPFSAFAAGGDGWLYHHLNSIVPFLQKERYNIIVRAISCAIRSQLLFVEVTVIFY